MVDNLIGTWIGDMANSPENKDYITLLCKGDSSKATHFTTVISKEGDNTFNIESFLEGQDKPVLKFHSVLGESVKEVQPGIGEVEIKCSIEGNSILSEGSYDGKALQTVKYYVDGDHLVAEKIVGDKKSLVFRAARA